MTTQQQAYIEGFVKRANEYGFSNQEALSILKQASELKGNQHKLDVDKDGKIEASDLRKLRQRKQAGVLLKSSDWYDTLQGGLDKLQNKVIDPASNFVDKNIAQPVKNFFTPPPSPFDPVANPGFNERARQSNMAYANRDRSQDAPATQAPLTRVPLNTGTLTGGSAASRPVLNGGSVSATPFRSPGGTTAVRPTSVR
jgi:hypothetical protein